ncbi:PRC-barrel domain-containing protein [Clostridium sp.]|uniref:PRC-barrel domain-containing protein n=1 Tax=Clostridium sp. TaxID=1506 RepID=UPI002582789C|nr:PRC-barrel domain-containing protein [Clostridium sp.]
MYRRKDFILMDVYDLKGKKIGAIMDLLIDMDANSVRGFVISPTTILKKSANVLIEDIVSFNEYMIIKKLNKSNYLKFNTIKGLEVIDNIGCVGGIVEEIIFNLFTFKIKGLIVSRGFLQNFYHGKKIILQDDYIIGDKNIFYINKNRKFKFMTNFHKLNVKDGENEKEKYT